MEAGSETIDDDEWLLRTVPDNIQYIDPETEEVDGYAFRPQEGQDSEGLSLSREKYISPQELVNQKFSDAYYVVRVKAGDLRELGMELQPDPLDEKPGHMLITNLHSDNRREPKQETWQQQMARKLCVLDGFYKTEEE